MLYCTLILPGEINQRNNWMVLFVWFFFLIGIFHKFKTYEKNQSLCVANEFRFIYRIDLKSYICEMKHVNLWLYYAKTFIFFTTSKPNKSISFIYVSMTLLWHNFYIHHQKAYLIISICFMNTVSVEVNFQHYYTDRLLRRR